MMKRSVIALATAVALSTAAVAPATAAQTNPAAGSSELVSTVTAPGTTATTGQEDETAPDNTPVTPWVAFLNSSQQGTIGTIFAVIFGVVGALITGAGALKGGLPDLSKLIK